LWGEWLQIHVNLKKIQWKNCLVLIVLNDRIKSSIKCVWERVPSKII
jgi:hypothetical protein